MLFQGMEFLVDSNNSYAYIKVGYWMLQQRGRFVSDIYIFLFVYSQCALSFIFISLYCFICCPSYETTFRGLIYKNKKSSG